MRRKRLVDVADYNVNVNKCKCKCNANKTASNYLDHHISVVAAIEEWSLLGWV